MGISIEFASPDIFYALACFTYIIVGITCGIIRWCHMCHPYDKQADFFYPARRQVTFYFAATVLQFPYIYYAHMTLTCGFTSARLASSITRCVQP